MEWRQEKDMPVFMYIFLNKIEDTEEVRWTEKEKSEGHKTYKKLLELADGDSSDVIKKCLRIIKETRHIVEYELWNKIVGISEKLSDNFVIFEKKNNILVMSDGM